MNNTTKRVSDIVSEFSMSKEAKPRGLSAVPSTGDRADYNIRPRKGPRL